MSRRGVLRDFIASIIWDYVSTALSPLGIDAIDIVVSSDTGYQSDPPGQWNEEAQLPQTDPGVTLLEGAGSVDDAAASDAPVLVDEGVKADNPAMLQGAVELDAAAGANEAAGPRDSLGAAGGGNGVAADKPDAHDQDANVAATTQGEAVASPESSVIKADLGSAHGSPDAPAAGPGDAVQPEQGDRPEVVIEPVLAAQELSHGGDDSADDKWRAEGAPDVLSVASLVGDKAMPKAVSADFPIGESDAVTSAVEAGTVFDESKADDIFSAGVVNGSIGSLLLNPLLRITPGGTLTVGDPEHSTTAGQWRMRASLNGRANSVNQIGYVVLAPDEAQIADSLLADLSTLRARAQILFFTLEASDVVLPESVNFGGQFRLMNGQSIRFFEVIASTLDELTSTGDARLRFLAPSDLRNGQRSIAYSSVSGVSFSLDLLEGEQGLNEIIGQQQGEAPLLDFTSIGSGRAVRGTIALGREAAFDSIVGFYRTFDVWGSVRSENGEILRPGDVGYSAAALDPSNRVDVISGLSVSDGATDLRTIELGETTFLAPFAQVNGSTFFAFADANADGFGHFRVLGQNLLGFEDVFGGGDRDFDDLVIGLKLTGYA